MFHSTAKPVVLLSCVSPPDQTRQDRLQLQYKKEMITCIEEGKHTPLYKTVEQDQKSLEHTIQDLQSSGLHRQVWILHLIGDLGIHTNVPADQEDSVSPQEVITSILPMLPELKLIFIQGKISPQLMDSLLKTDIPAIIASNENLDMAKWQAIAQSFYDQLNQGLSIAEAYTELSMDRHDLHIQEAHYFFDEDKVDWVGRDKDQVPLGIYYFKENLDKIRQRARAKLTGGIPIRSTSKLSFMQKAAGLTTSMAIVLLLSLVATGLVFFTMVPEKISLFLSTR